MDLRDVGMVQRGQRSRLACETRHSFRVARERLRQDLDRHVPIQPGITRAKHRAHPAGAEFGEYFIRPEARTGSESQASWIIRSGNVGAFSAAGAVRVPSIPRPSIMSYMR